jgi:riboflavin transporter FmnP
VAASSTRTRIWIGGGAVYVAVYVAIAWWYVGDPDLPLDEKVAATVGVAVLPAIAFVAGAVPLVRRSRSVVALVIGAAVTAVAAFAQLLLTFGFSLPLSAILLGLAVADASRAAAVAGKSRRDTLLVIGGVLALCFLVPAVTWQLAVVGVALLVGLIVWRVARG